MKIYIAASFCYEDKAKTSERKYLIEKITSRLQRTIPGFYDNEYYLPHQLTIPNAWDISLEEWSNAVYQHDIEALNNAHLVIFISFGKENNAGSAWEVGYVCGINTHSNHFKKPIVCIKMTDEPESLMITNSVDAIISEAEIETYDWDNLPAYKTKMEKIS
jgi:nucleoside 2-deoxyribosyltransferase